MDHGIQHLCGCDNVLACSLRQLDHLFLINRYFLEGNFHAHVTSGNHDSVSCLQDLLQVIKSLGTLDLGNYLHGAVLLIQDLPDGQNVILCPDKRSSYKIKALLTAEDDIRLILLAEVRHSQLCTGHINALLVGNGTSVNNAADDICISNILNMKLDKTIVKKNGHTALAVLGQVLVGDGNLFVCSLNLSGSQCECLSGLKLCLVVLKVLKPYLRALCIKHGSNRQLQLIS